MCGRFSLTSSWKELKERFDVDFPEEIYRPRYNAAPTQDMLVVPQESPHNAYFYRWGLIPSWSKDEKIGIRLINARAETIAEKPMFRSQFRNKRCLVLADGFYEWDKKGVKRTPYRITLKNEEPFAFAGIYDSWRDESGKEIKSFSIITTASNERISKVHDRMPVILDKRGERDWLNPEKDPAELEKLLRPFPKSKIRMHEISRLVNSPKNDIPDVMKAL